MKQAIQHLTEIIQEGDFDEKYLSKYKQQYLDSSERYSKICEICENLEKEGFPYDCFCKPTYCVKNQKDYDFITLYDELQMNIYIKNYG